MPVKSRLWSDNTRSTEGFLGNDYLLEPVEIRIPRSRGFRLREFVTDAEQISARTALRSQISPDAVYTHPDELDGTCVAAASARARSCGCAGRAFFGMWRGPIKKAQMRSVDDWEPNRFAAGWPGRGSAAMRVVLGSVVAAMLALAGLSIAVGQAGLTARYADAMPVQRLAPDATGRTRMIAAREGGPAIYGWLSTTSSHDH